MIYWFNFPFLKPEATMVMLIKLHHPSPSNFSYIEIKYSETSVINPSRFSIFWIHKWVGFTSEYPNIWAEFLRI